MKTLRPLIAVLLLVLLGGTVFTSAFASNSAALNCDKEVLLTSENLPMASSAVIASHSQGDEQHSACTDPCHFGRSHFCHCGAVFQTLPSSQPASIEPVAFISSDTNSFDGAYLEGLTRPPRHFS